MKGEASFRHLSDTVLADGRVSTFVRGEFSAPDGVRFERDVVRHPGAVAVAAVVDGCLVLVRQYRAPLDRFLYEIPAGLRDVPGEPPVETAHRELIEEAGLRADSMELVATVAPAPGLTDEIVEIFVATGIEAVAADAQGVEEEWMSIEHVPLGEVDAMIRAGEIIDGKTIVAMYALGRT